jgi:hypothetical protein
MFSLNANLFGPDTELDSDSLIDSALYLYRNTNIQTAIIINEINGEVLNVQKWGLIKANDLANIPIVFISSSISIIEAMLSKFTIFNNRVFNIKDLYITDDFDIEKKDEAFVVTNYPLLKRDWIRSDVFYLDDKYHKTDELDGQIKKIGSDYCFEFSDLIYSFKNKLLYKDNLLIKNSAEPFGEWPSNFQLDLNNKNKLTEINHPILYLGHPFSINYNIFFHETLSSISNWDKYPHNTKVFLSYGGFRVELLNRLGITNEKIIISSAENILFKKVYIPIRKLNLKYIGPSLFWIYEKLCSSIEKEINTLPDKSRKIYLDRMSVQNNTGANRFITNNDELLNELANFNFLHSYAENLSFAEKFQFYSEAKIVITAIGANLVNIALAKNISIIILLVTPLWGIYANYWTNILKFRHPKAKIIIFEDCVVEDNGLSKDPFNKPFKVNINALKDILVNLEAN